MTSCGATQIEGKQVVSHSKATALLVFTYILKSAFTFIFFVIIQNITLLKLWDD